MEDDPASFWGQVGLFSGGNLLLVFGGVAFKHFFLKSRGTTVDGRNLAPVDR